MRLLCEASRGLSHTLYAPDPGLVVVFHPSLIHRGMTYLAIHSDLEKVERKSHASTLKMVADLMSLAIQIVSASDSVRHYCRWYFAVVHWKESTVVSWPPLPQLLRVVCYQLASDLESKFCSAICARYVSEFHIGATLTVVPRLSHLCLYLRLTLLVPSARFPPMSYPKKP